jgi:hypothetical protein
VLPWLVPQSACRLYPGSRNSFDPIRCLIGIIFLVLCGEVNIVVLITDFSYNIN